MFLASPAWSASYEIYFANAGVPATGLSPAWTTLKLRADGSDIGSPPSFTPVGGGWYKYTASPTTGQVWLGVVDGGAALANADRYVPVRLAPEDVFLDYSVAAASNPWGLSVAGNINSGTFGKLLDDLRRSPGMGGGPL